MTKHDLCSPWGDFADAKEEQAFLVLEARRIVLWAGSLVQPGEEIGGIGNQLQRASRMLQLHYGVCWRAYQKRSGPEIYPCIYEARNKLVERLAHSATIYPFPSTPVAPLPRKQRRTA